MTFLWEFEEKHLKQVSVYRTQSWVEIRETKSPAGTTEKHFAIRRCPNNPAQQQHRKSRAGESACPWPANP
jgi:hypothetical protein